MLLLVVKCKCDANVQPPPAAKAALHTHVRMPTCLCVFASTDQLMLSAAVVVVAYTQVVHPDVVSHSEQQSP